MDESTDTLRMTDVYQLHVGAAPDWAAPSDSSQGSRPTGPRRQSESAPNPVDRHIKARKGKATLRQAGDVAKYATRLALNVITLADALSNWFS
jgi:hypothetical protein